MNHRHTASNDLGRPRLTHPPTARIRHAHHLLLANPPTPSPAHTGQATDPHQAADRCRPHAKDLGRSGHRQPTLSSGRLTPSFRRCLGLEPLCAPTCLVRHAALACFGELQHRTSAQRGTTPVPRPASDTPDPHRVLDHAQTTSGQNGRLRPAQPLPLRVVKVDIGPMADGSPTRDNELAHLTGPSDDVGLHARTTPARQSILERSHHLPRRRQPSVAIGPETPRALDGGASNSRHRKAQREHAGRSLERHDRDPPT